MIGKTLFLSREFVDGESVSEYVRSLAGFLAGKGIEVHVVCFGNSELEEEIWDKVHVHRVPLMIHGDSLFNWSMLMNNELKRRARELFEDRGFDVIHGNDWITATSAISLAKFTEKPLVVTIHSTEKERGFGVKHSGMISEMEWMMAYEASRVLVNNRTTHSLLRSDFQVPEDKVKLIDPLKHGWQGEVLEVYETIERTSK